MNNLHKNYVFRKKHIIPATLGYNPFRPAIPFWGQFRQLLDGLSPKRYCGTKGVKEPRLSENDPAEICYLYRRTSGGERGTGVNGREGTGG